MGTNVQNNYDIAEALTQPFIATTSRSFLLRLVLWGTLLTILLYAVLGRFLIVDLVAFMNFIAEAETTGNADLPPGFVGLMVKLFVLMIFFWMILILVEAAYHKNLLFGIDHGFFPFRLGNAELMVFLSHLVVFGILIGLYILTILLVILTMGFGVILMIPLIFVIFWVMVRLSTMGALSVKEGRLKVREAWQLSKPYFWIMFGTFVIIAVASYIITTIIQYTAMFAFLGDFTAFEGMDGATGEEILSQLGEILSKPSVFIPLIISIIVYTFAQIMSYIWYYGVGNLVVRLSIDNEDVFG